MAALAPHAPSARRSTFPFDCRTTFTLRPPRRLPPPTAAPPSPAATPLSFAGMELGAESSTTPALSSSTPPPPVQQGPPRGAGLPSVEEAATGVEQAVLWQSSLPVPMQAAIGRNQVTRKILAARSSKAAAPPLQDPPAATGGDAYRAHESTKIDCIDEGERSGEPVKVVAPKSCNKIENIHKCNREIASEDDEQKGGDDLGNTGLFSSQTGSLIYDEVKDDETIKIIIQKTVQEAVTRALESPSRSSVRKDFINDLVKRAMDDSLLSSQPSNSPMSRVDRMKLVREALSEHQTFSRVLYVLALGTPFTLLIARVVRSASSGTEKNMILNTGVEMGISFGLMTICHLYLIFFHFVQTEGPRVSIWLMRLIILFLCLLLSAWMLIYSFYMPQNLFRPKFWWITGTFLVFNWISSASLGCTGLLKEECMVDIE